MGSNTEVEKKPKRKIWAIIAVVLVIGLICVAVGHQMTAVDDTEIRQEQEMQESTESDGNSFTEEGTTSMGTVSQTAEFSLTTALMYVEEVYVEAGDTVAEGDALFKITEDSIAEAEAYYEKRVASAKDYLTEVKLAYEAGEMEAVYIKQDALSKAESASATLESSLQELEDNVEEKYTKWQEAAYKISAYKDNLYNNLYYTSAGIDEKTAALASAQEADTVAQAEYEAATAAYTQAKAQFEAAMTTVNSLVAGTQAETESLTMKSAAAEMVSAYENMAAAETVYDEKRTVSEQAAQAKQKAEQDLEQAKQSWQRNVANAEQNLEQLENSVDSLKLSYDTANMEAETKRLELEKEYENSLLEGEYAEIEYNNTVEGLKSTVEAAQTALDTLLEAQAALLALEDGVVTAQQSGTLATVAYEAGDIMMSGVAFVTYYDTDTITISVEVEQENIAKIAVSDSVAVAISGNRRGSIEGTITSIASSATSGGSVSDVTYTVVISIDNTQNSLSAGQSATITFEYGE